MEILLNNILNTEERLRRVENTVKILTLACTLLSIVVAMRSAKEPLPVNIHVYKDSFD